MFRVPINSPVSVHLVMLKSDKKLVTFFKEDFEITGLLKKKKTNKTTSGNAKTILKLTLRPHTLKMT